MKLTTSELKLISKAIDWADFYADKIPKKLKDLQKRLDKTIKNRKSK